MIRRPITRPMKKRPPKKDNIVSLRRGDQIHRLDETRPKFRVNVAVIITAVIILFGILSSLMIAAQMSDMRRELTQARNARDAALDANRTLASQLPQPFTIEEIEQKARERLGMNRPDPAQIIYINVPPMSHVVFNPDADILPQDSSFWQELRVFASDIINRFFGG